MNDQFADLDPMDRLMPGESHFALVGRDPLAPGWILAYADARERKPKEKVMAIISAALDKYYATPRNPQKDAKHAWSAREVARRMEEWYRENIRGEAPVNRVNTAPDRDTPDHISVERDYTDIANDDPGALGAQATIDALKTARPPTEPEEST